MKFEQKIIRNRIKKESEVGLFEGQEVDRLFQIETRRRIDSRTLEVEVRSFFRLVGLT